MGLLDPFRRFFRRMAESDEQRYAEEVREWAAKVPGAVPIAEAPVRSRVKLAGVVRRITVRPLEGTRVARGAPVRRDRRGHASSGWADARSTGLNLGTRLVVEGLLAEHRSERRMVNPTFEFAA